MTPRPDSQADAAPLPIGGMPPPKDPYEFPMNAETQQNMYKAELYNQVKKGKKFIYIFNFFNS